MTRRNDAIRRETLTRYDRETGESVHIDARRSGTARDIWVYVWIDGQLSHTDTVRTWAAAQRLADSCRAQDLEDYRRLIAENDGTV